MRVCRIRWGNSSPWFEEIALVELENNCLKELGDSVLFYRRYVNACFLVIKNTDTDSVFNTLNNFNKFLKFTIEEDIDKKLNYLDIVMLDISANHGLELAPWENWRALSCRVTLVHGSKR